MKVRDFLSQEIVVLNIEDFYFFLLRSLQLYCNFLDTPGQPGVPEIKDYDRDFVELQWTRPQEDGGSPITGYVIEKREKYK